MHTKPIFLLIYWLSCAAAFGAQEGAVVPGEVLLQLRAGGAKSAGDAATFLRSIGARTEPEALFASPVQNRAKRAAVDPLRRWYRVSIDPQVDPVAWAQRATRWHGVERAQANLLRRHAAARLDSLRSEQWALDEIGWRSDAEGDRVLVAVIDSGVDYEHPDIQENIWHNSAEVAGVAGIDDDGNGYIDDVVGWDFSDAPGLPGIGDFLTRDSDPRDESGHGTHVAGIIAAVADNGIGIAGVASNAQIMVLRAGFNLPGGGYLEDDDIAAAILYAVDNGAHVINMSWGDPRPGPLIRDAVRYAHDAGVVLVAAAGNEGEDAVFFPGRLSETIAVGASAPGGEVLAFSNVGPSIDLVAPGYVVTSLLPGGGYGQRSGTSMAAPHVTGLAALLLGRRPQWTHEQVRAALRASAVDVLAPGWDRYSGSGLAHFAALEVVEPPQVRMVNPVQDGVIVGSDVPIEWRLEGVDDWVLEWGAGRDPLTWSALAEGAVDAEDRGSIQWSTERLPRGPYQLRLRGRWGQRWLEDRARVWVRRSAEPIVDLRSASVLLAGARRQVVEWETEEESAGLLLLERAGDVVHEERVAGGRRQRVVLPVDLPAGTYDISVRAEWGGEGEVWERLEGVEIHNEGIVRWPLRPAFELPAGYVLPSAIDANGDGLMELVQMGYGGGLQYNAVDYYQVDASVPSRIFTSLQLYIPWHAGDGDGDGLLDVLGVDAQRVRLFEAPSAGAFPRNVAWEQRDVWGGEVADLDGDGRDEFLLRSARGSYFQVYEAQADNDYAEVAVLNRSSGGTNELGQRQVVGDLDGDGRGELIGGDGDGDLFVFEAVADGAYRPTWELDGDGDARTVGGGADLDGDGQMEFVVGRFYDDPFDIDARGWQVEVYGATGNNQYALEWQDRILGASFAGSGIHWGDLDGDGQIEWALVAVPDVYVFSSPRADTYEPVWRQRAVATQRPFFGDLDGDGRLELAFNGEDGVVVARYEGRSDELYPPAYIDAFPLANDRVQIEWQGVEGAVGYRIYRDGIAVGDSEEMMYVDMLDTDGPQPLRYWVRALAADGTLGAASDEHLVVSGPRPHIERVERLSSRHLSVAFSQVMRRADSEPFRFRVEPDIGIPSSAVFDRDGLRAVLAFEPALPDSGAFALVARGLRAEGGGLLAEQTVQFELVAQANSARLLRAEALDAHRVVLHFDKSIRQTEDIGLFSLGEGIAIESVYVDGASVLLTLSESAALRPLGRAYRVAVDGLLDKDGLPVRGESSFLFAAADLRRAGPFPNPYIARRGVLVFGFLPRQATVAIYDAQGQLLRQLEERDGDGGVLWDGTNEANAPLASGVYYYRIMAGGQSKVGSLALVR